MTDQQKQTIDAMSYFELLRLWRHAPSGSSALLQGECGTYYAKVMAENKAALAPGEAVQISKKIGW